MKKQLSFFILLLFCLFTVQFVLAQTPQNRTPVTIVADALSQMPAKDSEQYHRVMNDLVTSGEEGLIVLIKQLYGPGDKSNDQLEYAISGWAHTVANTADQRLIAAAAFEKGLSLNIDSECKAFLMRQLELVGSDRSIEALAPFLSDERLAGPASQTLVVLHTEKANETLLLALKNERLEATKLKLIHAIGLIGNEKSESLLLGMLSMEPTLPVGMVLVKALAGVGGKASLDYLKKAAEKVKYSYQKNDVTAAYLQLLKKRAETDAKQVQKQAFNLLSKARALRNTDMEVAATEILMALPKTNKLKLLEYALERGEIVYLTTTLQTFPAVYNEKAVNKVISNLTTAQPEAKVALLYWLGSRKIESAIPEIAKYLSSSDPTIQTAAIRSLNQLGGQAAINALIQMLQSDSAPLVSQIQEALLASPGDLSESLMAGWEKASSLGKKTALHLMATRRMTSLNQLVFDQMSIGDAEIRTAAAEALPFVVTEKNLPELLRLLEKTEKTEQSEKTLSIQKAIFSALSGLSPTQQMNVLTRQMTSSPKSYLYFDILARLGNAQSLETLLNAYKMNTGEAKAAALEALTKWKTMDALYPMMDIIRTSKDQSDKNRCVDALVSQLAGSDEKGAVKRMILVELFPFAQTDTQKKEIIRLLGSTNSYQALLFIEPCLAEPALQEVTAQAAMSLALNNPSFAGKKTTEIMQKVGLILNSPDAGYQREAIKKYLADNHGTDGFEPVFNGRNLDGWKGLVGNPMTRATMSESDLSQAQAKADEEARKNWLVEKAELLFTGMGENLCTKKKYGDFEMLIDWKLYPGGEPDAGIYLRGTPQVQIWDTARVKDGAQVGSGGLYNNQQNPSKPLLVADQKVGEWNTFHIQMKGDRVTVFLNGELVTDNVLMENFWDRNLPIPSTEQIELQAHGSKVCYRNIYVKELARTEPFKLTAEEQKEGFDVLFDGSNMHQWTGNTTDYVMEDGAMVIYPSRNFGGNLYTKKEYGDFNFRFDFQLTAGANNGLGIRTPMEGDAAYVGMELQILDNEDPIYKDLNVYQYHGSVYGVIPAKRGFLKPVGQWNSEEVIAKGNRIKVILNGTVILDGDIREASQGGTVDKKEHPGLFNPKGHIGFLGHGSIVKFKNIRIREL